MDFEHTMDFGTSGAHLGFLLTLCFSFWLGWYTSRPRSETVRILHPSAAKSVCERCDKRVDKEKIVAHGRDDGRTTQSEISSEWASDLGPGIDGDSSTMKGSELSTDASEHSVHDTRGPDIGGADGVLLSGHTGTVLEGPQSGDPALHPQTASERTLESDQQTSKPAKGHGREQKSGVRGDIGGYLEPPKVFSTHDGVVACRAVSLVPDFTYKIKCAIEYERQYLREKSWASRQIDELNRFYYTLGVQITLKGYLLDDAVKEQHRAAREPQSADNEGIAALRGDLHTLRYMQDLTKIHKQRCENKISEGAKTLLRLHIDVSEYLETAFVNAKMMKPASTQQKEAVKLDLAREFLAASKGRRYEPAPERVRDPTDEELRKWEESQAYGEAEDQAEEHAKFEMLQLIYDSMVTRDRIRRESDEKAELRHADWQKLCEAAPDGQPSMTKGAFGLQWDAANGMSIKELHDAHDVLIRAYNVAVDAGIRVENWIDRPLNGEMVPGLLEMG